MKTEYQTFMGRQVLGVRSSLISELQSILYMLGEYYPLFRTDDVLSYLYQSMHVRLLELSPDADFEEPICDEVLLFLGKPVEGEG